MTPTPTALTAEEFETAWDMGCYAGATTHGLAKELHEARERIKELESATETAREHLRAIRFNGVDAGDRITAMRGLDAMNKILNPIASAAVKGGGG